MLRADLIQVFKICTDRADKDKFYFFTE